MLFNFERGKQKKRSDCCSHNPNKASFETTFGYLSQTLFTLRWTPTLSIRTISAHQATSPEREEKKNHMPRSTVWPCPSQRISLWIRIAFWMTGALLTTQAKTSPSIPRRFSSGNEAPRLGPSQAFGRWVSSRRIPRSLILPTPVPISTVMQTAMTSPIAS